MLNKESIEFLCNLVDIDIVYSNGIPTGYIPKEILAPRKLSNSIDMDRVKKQSNNLTTREDIYKCSYEEAKQAMGLEDIRFHWLLTENLYLAGGSVLNWLWREYKNEDYDFFLSKTNIDFALLGFIKEIGLVKINTTKYAETYSDNNNTLVQIVRLNYADPPEMINRFDINVCKFAVSADHLYVSRRAVVDLLSLTISPGSAQFLEKSLDRFLKYNRKGFFLDQSIRENFKYTTSDVPWITNDTDKASINDGEDEYVI